MKFLIAIFALATISAQASELTTYKCKQLAGEKLAAQVIVQELEDVTDSVSFGEQYDRVYRVKVDVIVKKNRQAILENSFYSFATAEDVYYKISAVKKEGMKFYTYLDEMDQAGIEFIAEDGSKTTIRLSCDV